MSHNTHEQFSTPGSSSQQSGGARAAPKRWATAATLLTLALGQVARAADGQLDPSFDGDGRVTLDVDNRGYQDHLVGVAVLPDGRIAVGGHTRARSDDLVAPDLDFVIGAFSSVNGSLDTGFGTNGGLTTTDIGGSQLARDEASALALQNDRGEIKIVLVGRSGPTGSRQFTAVRYRINGALDDGFGVEGIVETPVPGGDESVAYDVAVQTDGKIILAGVVGTQLDDPVNRVGDIALVRYNPDGSLDDGFGSNGTVKTSFAAGQFALASAVVVQPDGKIVAGGEVDPSGPTPGNFALVRYNQDGSLDNGVTGVDSTPGDQFGPDGKMTTGFGPGRDDSVADLVLQPDGKIVAGGTSSISDARVFALARYNVDGTIDQTFGTGGTQTTDFPSGDGGLMAALVMQPGGKLVAAGRTTRGSNQQSGDFALVRYQPNGREDTTFGEDKVDDIGLPGGEGVPDGFTITHFGPAGENTAARGEGVDLQSDGKIVVAGFSRLNPAVNSGNDFALARYQSSVVPENLTCQGRPPTVIGTPGDDILVGTEGNDVIDGLGGNDTIIALPGHDIICGGPGDDLIFGGPDSDLIEGGDGNDTLVGDDQFADDDAPDTLRGGEGDDRLFGAAGNDQLEGEAGNDELVGGAGDDVLDGGPGEDRLSGEGGADALAGGGGNDTLVGDDPFAGTGGPDMLQGGEGDDRLFGAAGNDQLSGDAGNDELVAGSGDDVLNGGHGDDRLFGEGGADMLASDAGNDTLVGDDLVADVGSPDVLHGGEGDDRLFGAAGNDQLLGDAGSDTLDGGAGNDQMDGGPSNDQLFGGSGKDTIRGGLGRDAMVGDAGRDVLRGGPGNDRLFGGPGRDKLLGQAGKDTMDGQGGSDRGIGGPGRPDRCFSMGPRGACENLDAGSPPKPPKKIHRPPPPVTPGSSPVPPVCNFPQCGP